MTTFFWADTHFNHRGILGHCSRPYNTVAEMNRGLVDRWNMQVTRESDVVWFLGDFGFHPGSSGPGEPLDALFHRLRGAKSLVVGNHDERNKQVLDLPWERVERLTTYRERGTRAELCHYALETWKGAFRGALMLYGHSHGTLKRKVAKRFDVGADCFWYPVPWYALLDLASRERFEAADHHEERP